MNNTHNRLKRVFLVTTLLSVAGALTVHSGNLFLRGQVPDAAPTEIAYRVEDFQRPSAPSSSSSSYSSYLNDVQAAASASFEGRVAARLQHRIANRFGFMLSFPQVLSGLREQQALLSRSVTVSFDAQDKHVIPAWTAGVHSAPQWMDITVSPMQLTYALSEQRLADDLRVNPPLGIRYPEDAALTVVETDADGTLRATTDGIAKTGDDFEPGTVASVIASAIVQSQTGVTISIHPKPGRIINQTGTDVGAMELLSTGHSDFAGSGNGRKSNVRKGIARYLHNSFVNAESNFSINSVLAHAPISEWEMALGIFGGGELRPVPGGGLCQVATTLYRAALNGGLPVLNRANHSLFVHYYEKYGLGIDATIFPGKQDLKFRNDTGHPMLIQAYTEGDEAFVNIYGTPDGRTARMEGPYFSVNAPESLVVNGRALNYNEIGWLQTIRFADGREQSNTVVSRYKSIPKSVVKEYLHAAAESKVAAR